MQRILRVLQSPWRPLDQLENRLAHLSTNFYIWELLLESTHKMWSAKNGPSNQRWTLNVYWRKRWKLEHCSSFHLFNYSSCFVFRTCVTWWSLCFAWSTFLVTIVTWYLSCWTSWRHRCIHRKPLPMITTRNGDEDILSHAVQQNST